MTLGVTVSDTRTWIQEMVREFIGIKTREAGLVFSCKETTLATY